MFDPGDIENYAYVNQYRQTPDSVVVCTNALYVHYDLLTELVKHTNFKGIRASAEGIQFEFLK